MMKGKKEMKEGYKIVSYRGHDVKIIETPEKNKIYFETELYQMNEPVKVGQAYDIDYKNLTENEITEKIKELMQRFLNFYEGCK